MTPKQMPETNWSHGSFNRRSVLWMIWWLWLVT